MSLRAPVGIATVYELVDDNSADCPMMIEMEFGTDDVARAFHVE